MNEASKLVFILIFTLLSQSIAQKPMKVRFYISEHGGVQAKTVALPLGSRTSHTDVIINWGDSSYDTVKTSGIVTHTYDSTGYFDATITGSLEWFGYEILFQDNPNPRGIYSIDDWGELGITSMEAAFYGVNTLMEVPDSLPSTVISTALMFSGATKFNDDISSWNVSNITDMSGMFSDATDFNSDISNWDVSNVTTMGGMFREAKAFNSDIGSWDVSNVTNMGAMFEKATDFNSDISGWNVSNVTTMYSMFRGDTYNEMKFNCDLSAWDVSNVTRMPHMFQKAINFDSDISNWDVSNVMSMSYMFSGATNFNSDISNWNVSNVTEMQSMFSGAESFNQNLNKWNVAKVTEISNMFSSATAFNGDISNWDVSNITDMSSMFNGASSFNGNISNWDISNVTSMYSMFSGVTLESTVYDNILIKWSQLENIESNVSFDAGARTQFTELSTEARQTLEDTYKWDIVDGGSTSTNIVNSSNIRETSFSISNTKISLPRIALYQFSVYSANGRMVKDFTQIGNTIFLSELDLAPGVYQMQVVQDADLFTGQFILR